MTISSLIKRRDKRPALSFVATEIGLDELRKIVAGRGREDGGAPSPEAAIALSQVDAGKVTAAPADGNAGAAKAGIEKGADGGWKQSADTLSFKATYDLGDSKAKQDAKSDSGKGLESSGKLGIEHKLAEGSKSDTAKLATGSGGSLEATGKAGYGITAKTGFEKDKDGGVAAKAGIEAKGEVSAKIAAEQKLGGVKLGTELGSKVSGTADAAAGLEYKDGKLVAKAEVTTKGELSANQKVELKDARGSTSLESGQKLTGSAEGGVAIENATLKLKVGAEAKQEAELAVKRVTTIASGIDLANSAAAKNATTASAEGAAKFGLEGINVKGEAKAEQKVSAELSNSLKFDGDKEVSSKVQVAAKAYAKAEAVGSVGTDGVKAALGAGAGVAVQAGSESKYSEGKNSIGGAITFEAGKKAAAGASAEVSVKDGVANIQITLKGTVLLGVEVKLNVAIDTKPVQVAANKALDLVRAQLAELEKNAGKTSDGRIDLTGEKAKLAVSFVEKYGHALAAEGSKQGGLFGTAHLVVGETVKSFGSSISEKLKPGITMATTVVEGVKKIPETVKNAFTSLPGELSKVVKQVPTAFNNFVHNTNKIFASIGNIFTGNFSALGNLWGWWGRR